MASEKFPALKGVWEITYACNMRCLHCGSQCGLPLDDELTTKEALLLTRDLAELGIKAITLSGGEPLLRDDWDQIAAALTNQGVKTNLITNGWLLDHNVIKKIIAAQISNVCLSIDGNQKNHDRIRKPGSFDKAIDALALLQKEKIPAACVTSINKKNVFDLPKIKNVLLHYGVKNWQLQLALPMGNFLAHRELVIDREEIPAIVSFLHEVRKEEQITLHLGDNFGYYSSCGEEILRRFSGNNENVHLNFTWRGCHAGKRILGIRANGEICGCLALRDPRYLAGNIRDRSLKEIWQDDRCFAWSRNFKKNDLLGFCHHCLHGNLCLGGCNAQKFTSSGSIYVSNPLCLYRLEIENQTKDLGKIDDYETLVKKLEENFLLKKYQVAEKYLSKALRNNTDDLCLNEYAGMIHYHLQNYDLALKHNDLVLGLSPKNYRALYFKGLSLYRLNQVDLAVKLIEQSLCLVTEEKKQNEMAMKLVQILIEQNHISEAIEKLKLYRSKSSVFQKESEKLFLSLIRLQK
jgi:radical SAM protein with 4Fe4S-binding SPASM domain